MEPTPLRKECARLSGTLHCWFGHGCAVLLCIVVVQTASMQASLNNTISYAQSVRKIGFILRKKFYSELTQCILNQLCTWLVQRSTSVPCVCSVLQQTTVAEALEARDTQARQLAECQTRSFNAHLRARTLERLLCKRSVIVATSLLRISVIGSIARGDQRLSCSMRGSMAKLW